jgi:hypothetical protein
VNKWRERNNRGKDIVGQYNKGEIRDGGILKYYYYSKFLLAF